MARSYNQKAKVLYLERMLNESSKENPVTMQEILNRLEEQGIKAERKSIYDDMETLREFGMKIQYRRSKEGGYYQEENESGASQVQIEQKTELQTTEPQAEAKNEKMQISVNIPKQDENSKEIKLLCRNSVRNEVRRVLGDGFPCKLKGDDSFVVNLQTEPDKAFFGWLVSMGRSVHILKPKKVAAAYRDYLKSIARDYKGIEK